MSEDVFHLGIKGLVRNAAGEVLLLQVNKARLDGAKRAYWDLPGGRVERGGTIEQTLHREMAEELSVTSITNIQPVGMVLSNIRIPVGDGETVGLILGVYSCSLPDDAEIRLSEEHVDMKWCAPEEAAELLAVKYPGEFCQVVKELPE